VIQSGSVPQSPFSSKSLSSEKIDVLEDFGQSLQSSEQRFFTPQISEKSEVQGVKTTISEVGPLKTAILEVQDVKTPILEVQDIKTPISTPTPFQKPTNSSSSDSDSESIASRYSDFISSSIDSDSPSFASLNLSRTRLNLELKELQDVGDSVERKYRNEVGNNEDGLTREWLAIVQKRQQLINDRDELEIKREEKKVEKECTHLNLRINKFMDKKVNRELGPTREQSNEIERLQNRLIQLVEKKNELVFQLDELQDAADMANENFLNSMKTEKDKVQESRGGNVVNGQGNAATQTAVSAVTDLGKNLFGGFSAKTTGWWGK
jgi:hypothetical protein